ncbi:PHD finger protein 20-like isoform X2 [Nelusetta ayraudi]|uniref:PHD finger protein 20-like isoform X2 n=1 Tax=Nelusetta ayraudi TaxID=303726 RepID=UPI003F6F5748
MRPAANHNEEGIAQAKREMKTPPDRSGIVFEVGAQLEARDRHKTWYPATIEKIDYDEERVLIHYRQWSRRHDEWFSWTSPYLRPLERVSLRRQGRNPSCSPPVFLSGTKVLACWTDCRFYPAKILSVNRDDSYTVRFFDGVVRTVKPTKVKPFQEKSRADRSAVGSEGWEEGESEEEADGTASQQVEEGEGQEEEEDEEEEEEEEEEEVMSEMKDGAETAEGTPCEPSASHPPVKKRRRDDGDDAGAQSEQPMTDDSAQTTGLPGAAHADRDVLLERQVHLPTTHKFSREPLYRVIKNQPPPILSIELDHNPFKCPAAGCSKSFRKASLLHYHIKYYHSEQQQQQPEDLETPRRKRLTSKAAAIDFLSDCKGQEQSSSYPRAEQSIMGTADLKKEGGAELRRERKNFLRVKLKKKKKKKRKKKRKSQSGFGSSDDEMSISPPLSPKVSAHQHSTAAPVDDGSDWSTLTAESGEDTHSWSFAMETEECEVVRCVCEAEEENDFMIQCESCLCWQHGTCMGLYEDNVPLNYICYCCRQAAGRTASCVWGWRRGRRSVPEPDLLISSHMFGLSCVKENYSEVNASKILHTSRLLAHTHGLDQVLSGLQLQISLLHSPSHPELKLWRLPWKQEEGPGLRGEAALCYVSSEHCYPKPDASWEKSEDGEEQEVSVKEEHNIKEETEPVGVVSEPSGGAAATASAVKKDNGTDVEAAGHAAPAQTLGQEGRPASVSECQLNLLGHVESVHRQISGRMDLIERELDVLESWLDHSGELEPPDPLSRLPQLKQRIRRLLCDLCTVRRLSVWH